MTCLKIGGEFVYHSKRFGCNHIFNLKYLFFIIKKPKNTWARLVWVSGGKHPGIYWGSGIYG